MATIKTTNDGDVRTNGAAIVEVDKFDAMVSAQAYQEQVISLVRANVHKGQKVIANDALLADYRENQVVKGLKGKDEVDAIVALETEAMAVRNMASIISTKGVQLGVIMADAKRRLKHGNWTYFCQMRVGLPMKTVQRALSAARVVTIYPKLMEVADKIPDTILADMGGKKDLSDEMVDEIFQLASNDALDVKKAREVMTSATAVNDVPLPFNKVSKSDAAYAISVIMESIKPATADISAKLTGPEMKHSNFTKWMQGISRGGDKSTDLQKELRKLMVYAWFLEESLYDTKVTLIDYPVDGSPAMTPEQEPEQEPVDVTPAA